MISAVARIYRPGCKFDHALILEGPQGPGKSTIAEILALDREWFADEIADLGSKDAAQDLAGKWIVEIAELSALRRSEVERVKAFFSRSVDHYRPSYGRRSQDFPRRCVFIGSTNAHEYLADQTGNRRFWPIRIGTIDLAGLRLDVDQLWAEAVVAYRNGEQWWLDAATEPVAADEQEKRRKVDVWEQDVLRWADSILAEPGIVTIGTLLERAIGMPLKDRDQAAAIRVGNILTAAGWMRRQKRIGSDRVRYYVPPSHPVTLGED